MTGPGNDRRENTLPPYHVNTGATRARYAFLVAFWIVHRRLLESVLSSSSSSSFEGTRIERIRVEGREIKLGDEPMTFQRDERFPSSLLRKLNAGLERGMDSEQSNFGRFRVFRQSLKLDRVR